MLKKVGAAQLKGVNILIIDLWGPLNNIMPLIEDLGGGGGCTVTPLCPWTMCNEHRVSYHLVYHTNSAALWLSQIYSGEPNI